MITRATADDIAVGWAHRETLRRGYECRPVVEEFDLGFAVWMRLPETTLTVPGEDATTVIDRETGRLSHWPNVPAEALEELYRQRRAAVVDPPRTSDAEVELKRNAHRRASPSVAAHITLGGKLYIARGAKGDQDLNHHPLVAAWLADVPAGHLVRGAERHAELLVLSDVLHETDRIRAEQEQPPLSLAEARKLMLTARFETFHIREPGDVLGGKRAEPCPSCNDALINIALVPWKQRIMSQVKKLDSGTDPQPGRFPPEVAWELAGGGWRTRPGPDAAALVQRAESVPGREHRLTAFPAALAALAEFGGVSPDRWSPGIAERVRWYFIGIDTSVDHHADALHELGTMIGARLFPIGAEGFSESVLAIDEHGRVFALDQGGEWFIADTMDEAMTALLLGSRTHRIRDDGTW
ncbi:SUKH-3 domain-containing protein [Actinoplanes sp. NPDC051494]|uniref:SUKH-3 domain-containing protein n=1 Tax=Actinoplanes sp. NPDC051494 TaxID=3363907 RepID=UPI0037B2BFCC